MANGFREEIDAAGFIVSETRHQRMFRTGAATPLFLQGVYPFVGRGLFEVNPLHDELSYVVPAGMATEALYCRAGNHSEDLIYLALCANGKPVRYLPVGPKSEIHVTLAIVDSYPAGTRIEIGFAAPRGEAGTAIVDFGFAEVRTPAV